MYKWTLHVLLKLLQQTSWTSQSWAAASDACVGRKVLHHKVLTLMAVTSVSMVYVAYPILKINTCIFSLTQISTKSSSQQPISELCSSSSSPPLFSSRLSSDLFLTTTPSCHDHNNLISLTPMLIYHGDNLFRWLRLRLHNYTTRALSFFSSCFSFASSWIFILFQNIYRHIANIRGFLFMDVPIIYA